MIFPRWELRHTADPLDTRAYGGGGDGGAGQMREDELARQRKVQEAVDAINVRFGYPGSGGTAPTREQFTKTTTGPVTITGQPITLGSDGADAQSTTWTATPQQTTSFDEAAYNAALQAHGASAGEAATNKTARDGMYSEIAGAVRDTAMRDVDRQYSKASQRNKFGLARGGIIGGSVDAEAGGELSTLYGEGKLKATQAGQQAGSDLRVTDEKTRQNLIQLAQSGLDTGTAASLAAGQMSSAAELARNQANTASVGRLFDDMAQAYVTNQVGKARYPAQAPQQPAAYGYGGFSPSRYTGTVQR